MDRMQTKAAIVIELLDQFSGKPIVDGQAWLETDKDQKVIRKGNGCYVFLYPFTQGQKVKIHSGIFREFEVSLMQSSLDCFCRQIVWLEPQETYLFPEKTTILTGTIKDSSPLDEIRIFLEKSKKVIRLSEDYGEGQGQVCLYGVSGEVQDTQYVLYRKDVFTFFSIQQQDSQAGAYQLQEVLGSSFRKEDTQVYKVYVTTIREDGTFFIAVPEVCEDTTAHIVTNKKHTTTTIKAGQWNTVE